jgi:DNA-binding NarL/FixJ family response regulator
LIEEVHHGAPDARILVLSGCRADPEVIQWIAKGAHGYFTTNLSLPLLVAAVRMLAAGGVFLPPELSWRLLEGMPRQNVPA